MAHIAFRISSGTVIFVEIGILFERIIEVVPLFLANLANSDLLEPEEQWQTFLCSLRVGPIPKTLLVSDPLT
jgi:hypothetical protein